MSKLIGIDLGTSNSCMAVLEGDHPKVIPNREGTRTTPSVIAFDDHGAVHVGQVARRQAATNPKKTVLAVKRLMGRKIDDKEIQKAKSLYPYSIVPSKNQDAWVRIGDKDWSPAELSARILAHLKQDAEDYLGEEVRDAVITVPAYFNDAQRQATRDAGLIAGLNVKRIINEPTAAALAYGFGQDDRDAIIAVYDLGGGTFDVSILQIGDGLYEVLATHGDTYLGGEDFDMRLVNHLCQKFLDQNQIDLKKDPMALQRIKEAAEQAKHELSQKNHTDVHLPFIAADSTGPKHLQAHLLRAEFEDMVRDLVQKTLDPCRQALDDADLSIEDIDEVILVGGMTRMPLVRAEVEKFFGKKVQRGLNPDEVVAMGAAVQGSILKGELKEVILLDVTPMTLGVETEGGTFTPLIPRNTQIPCRATEVFTTTEDNQSMVKIHVLQGERPLAADNHSLARFELHGIPPAPAGEPKIEVAFQIDADGIVSVGARDLGTGRVQEIKITPSSGLSEAEIQEMIAVAEHHREEDEKRKARIEQLNRTKAMLNNTFRSFREFGEYLSDEDRQEVQNFLDQCKQYLDDPEISSEDLEEIYKQIELTAHHLAEAIYSDIEE